MTFKFEKGKEEIIHRMVERIKQRPGHTEELCAEFARQFFGTIALEDLKVWKNEDLYAACMHFWRMIEHRKPEETKVCVYNPTFEADGWHSPYTVIEILLEDMPFLVNSIRMVIDRMGLFSNLIIHMGGLALARNHANKLTDIYAKPHRGEEVHVEAPIWIQINKLNDQAIIDELEHQLKLSLDDTRVSVEDWMPMRAKVQEIIMEIDSLAPLIAPEVLFETKAFLSWIDDHHFTFLGMIDYQLLKSKKGDVLTPVLDSGLGILRSTILASRHETLGQVMSASSELKSLPSLLLMTKTNTLSTIHRNVYTDYIGIKRLNAKGEVIGERRVIGLYTSAAYNTNPKHIPFLRHKVTQVMKNSDLNPRGHAGKVLLNILETLPRDDLIQMTDEELLEMAMGIFHLQERRRIRLFAREDVYKRFVSCLVYIPRDQFNTSLREAMQGVLARAFESDNMTYTTWFSESVLARIHFVVRLRPSQEKQTWDFKAIEDELIEVGRSWTDDFQKELFDVFNEEKANLLYMKYKHVFSNGYCDNFEPHVAVRDMMYVESLKAGHDLLMHFYRDADEKDSFRLKIFQHDRTIPLAEILPIIENLGMKAISERPYCLRFEDGSQVWITDFSLYYIRPVNFELEEMQTRFQTAFVKIWTREAENDGFNQLVLAAGLDWCQVKILRAYAKYFKQIGFTFSQEYIEATLVKHASIAQKCVALFEARFDPNAYGERQARGHVTEKLSNQIVKQLNEVSNLDEDKILRQYVSGINGTLRTNYYQLAANNEAKSYLSLKFNCHVIPGMPKPCPLCEIFIYSPRVEGVHLRGGKVARGGVRWSDRREDFRTEVLGLMKAQQVKNAIIVPTGAKGGFILKALEIGSGRDVAFQEAIACYRIFIRGLLDLTDNYAHGDIVQPKQLVCYDEPDTYLVVAADKGTATFSDYANDIAMEYHFWLGDAFASGGSVGYDHKKMGITAKGAWESVKRHFYERGELLGKIPFTVVGIGDMSGDVFGNGMLLSNQILLVAAFNHAHIFIDPNPDPRKSLHERQRMFALPRSSWSDYDKSILSQGGGVFERSAKSITVSKEMKVRFGIKKQEVEPNYLVQMLLLAEVDLLWSAGIGTFVKSSEESHADVGDRTNDAIRVNANELRCKIIGEGGNLGLTQQARVEYDFQGGLVYTDFIDNSAGVNCSDKEVNIKILLNPDLVDGKLGFEARNALLASMTDEVAALVLKDNIAQPKAINLAAFQASSIDLHMRYIHALEHAGKLDRQIENIPDDKALLEYKLLGKGLGLPSLSVLHCYSKMILKESLLASDLPEDPFLDKLLVESFPCKLKSQYEAQMKKHPLRREIIATKLCNIVVNEMGFSFVYRVKDETAASEASIVRAYLIARSVLGLESILNQVASFQASISAEHEKVMLMLYLRLVRRMVRWLLRNLTDLHIQKNVDRYQAGIHTLKQVLPEILLPKTMQKQNALLKTYKSWGISAELAYELTLTRPLFSALDLIEASYHLKKNIVHVATIYFNIGEKLEIDWLRSQVIAHPTETRWDGLSREAIRDDLDRTQRSITECLLQNDHPAKGGELACIDAWLNSRQTALTRWFDVVARLKSTQILNYTMFFVAVRQLMDLTEEAPLLEIA